MANEAKFTLSIEGDASAAGALFAAFKRQVRSDVAEIEKLTSQVKLFATLDADLKKAAASVDQTRAALAALKTTADALRKSGAPVGEELAKSLKEAEKASAAAEKEFAKQSAAVDKLRGTLVKAGVDVNNLAAAEAKLAVEAKKAAAAQAEQEAKTATGFKTLKDIQPEINRIVAGYQSLASSGKLSFGELSTLHASAQRQLDKLTSSVSGVGAAFREVRIGLIAFAAAFAGVVAGATQSAAAFRAFAEQLAAIGTIAEVSDTRLAELGVEVRKLSVAMGVDAVQAAKALYDIIGSGIPAGNAIEVLGESAKAARAGLTDIHTAAAVGVSILNAYGLQVTELEHVFDVLFRTVQDGVITFPEIAKNLGPVLPIARQANVALEELGAAFVVLTRAGIDAPEAATAIGRAIQELSAPAPEAAERMRELGIEFRGLVATVEQISQKNLSLQQLQGLIPEVRAIRAVASLSQNFKLLSDSLERAVKSAGTMKTAYDRMADTPQARIERFNAALAELNLTIGEFVTTHSAGFIEAATKVANAFNGMSKNAKDATINFVAVTGSLLGAYGVIRLLRVPINALIGALGGLGSATSLAAAGFTVATAGATALLAALVGFTAFTLGSVIGEWVPPLRIFGDILASTLRVFQAFGGVVLAFGESIRRGSLAPLKEAWAQLTDTEGALNDYAEAITGTTEKLRQQSEAQRLASAEMQKAADVASKSAETVVRSATGIIAQLDAANAAALTGVNTIQTRMTNLVASLGQSVAGMATNASQAISTIIETANQKITALTSFEVQRVQEVTAIQKAAFAERLGVLKKFGEDVIAAFNIESAARLAVAKKSSEAIQVEEGKRVAAAKAAGEDMKRVDQELAIKRQGILQDIVGRYREHVGTLLDIQRGHNENIRQLEEQRKGITRDAEEAIRELKRSTLTIDQQYSDKRLEIEQNIAKARKALQDGNNKDAELYAQKAIDAAKSIGQAVTKDGVEIVSQSAAVSTSIEQITRASNLLKESTDKRLASEKAGAKAAAEGLKEALPLLKDYETALKAVVEIVDKQRTLRVGLDIAAFEADLPRLQALLDEQKLLLRLSVDLATERDALNLLRERMKEGVPVDLKPVLTKMDAALEEIKQRRPELLLHTTKAQTQIKELQIEADKLRSINVDLTVKTDSIDAAQRKIDELKKNTSSTHTVTIKEIREGAGAPSSDTSTTFARGGMVGRVLRSPAVRAARAVFNAPMAAVQAVQGYARGGAVRAGGLGRVLGFATGGAVSPEEAIALSQSLQKAYGELMAVALAARSVKRAPEGLNLYDWSAEVLSKFHVYGTGRQRKIRDFVSQNFEEWLSEIEEARRTGSPVVLSDSAKALAFSGGGDVFGFARGGSVFRRPSWAHVPGQGNRDSVPALLQSGSFVMRKAAAKYYGGGLMGLLAQGFAKGGSVTEKDAEKWMIDNGFIVTPEGPKWVGVEAARAIAARFKDSEKIEEKDLPLFGGKDAFGVGKQPAKQQGSGTSAPMIDPKKGFQTGDSFQNNDPPLNFDTRPIPEVLMSATNVLAYAREMLSSVGAENPLLGSLLPLITNGIRAVESNPNDANAIKKLLQAAETIGTNPYIFAMWGKTTGAGGGHVPVWFVDWLIDRGMLHADGTTISGGKGIALDLTEIAKNLLGGAASDTAKKFFGGQKPKPFSFAAGGGIGDSVRAMLTPGEWVIKKNAVNKYGSNMMHAINSMMIPRSTLAHMLAAPAPYARFAEGGPVLGPAPSSADASMMATGPRDPIVVNLNASAQDILTERNIRNWIVPVLNKINRQT